MLLSAATSRIDVVCGALRHCFRAERAATVRLVASFCMSLEESDDVAVGVDVDRFAGGMRGQPGHGPHFAE